MGNRISYQDRVARVYRAASHVVGGTTFWLDYRHVAAMAGVGLSSAYRHAAKLCESGHLICVDPGLPGTRRRMASTWRWEGEPYEGFDDGWC